jgi:hypothetical protein
MLILIFQRRLPDVMRRLREKNEQNGPPAIP